VSLEVRAIVWPASLPEPPRGGRTPACGGRVILGHPAWPRFLLVLVCLLAFACGDGRPPIQVQWIATGEADVPTDVTHFEIDLAPGYVPGSLSVVLDYKPVSVASKGVSALMQPVSLIVPATGGRHVVRLKASFVSLRGRETHVRRFSYFVPKPAAPPGARLVSSWPSQGTQNLAQGEWIQLEFSEAPDDELRASFGLRCANRRIRFEVHEASATFWFLNPHGQLPSGKRCSFEWTEVGQAQLLAFTTAIAGRPAFVEYDRERKGLSSPFPDDYFTRSDPTSPTQRRIDIETHESQSPIDQLAAQLESDVRDRDGFSAMGHVYIALSDGIDLASLPQSAAESVHPASSVQMFDVDPRSETFTERIPFVAETREDLGAGGERQYSLLLFPLTPARARGRIGVVVTRALRVDPGRAYRPSPFMQRVFQPRHADDSEALQRARRSSGSALWVVENIAQPPIPREDMALIASYTTGSLDGLSRDLLHVRALLQQLPLPTFRVDRIDPEAGEVAAVVHGTWQAPRWRDGANVVRDEAGLPVILGTTDVPFTLALPRSVGEKGAPIVIYQHGNPGDAKTEVPIEARRGLAAAGFAVLGFTDVFNRELASDAPDETSIVAQLAASLVALAHNRRMPEYWLTTHAEQLALLRLVHALGDFDFLPPRGERGTRDLNVDAPISYLGVSEGANHAPAFLAYAPEVRAAALVAGGAPIAEMLTHQIDASIAPQLSQTLMGGEGRNLWLVLSLLQTAIDRQDPFNHARHLYRDPIAIDGNAQKASVLLIAGLEDSRIPNRFTDALAWLLGPVPMLEPSPRAVDFLPSAPAPITANMGPNTSAAYDQVVPAGIAGTDVEMGCSPYSMSAEVAAEGHFCAQVSPASIEQRIRFFLSALEQDAPVITNSISVE
jgi:hypothetical protein